MCSSKVVNQIPSLLVIPPAKPLHLHPNSLQRFLCLLNLRLEPSMRQKKRVRMIKKDLHVPILPPPCLLFPIQNRPSRAPFVVPQSRDEVGQHSHIFITLQRVLRSLGEGESSASLPRLSDGGPPSHIPTFTHSYTPYTMIRAKPHRPKGVPRSDHPRFFHRRPVADQPNHQWQYHAPSWISWCRLSRHHHLRNS